MREHRGLLEPPFTPLFREQLASLVFLIDLSFSWGAAWLSPPLRALREHILIVRTQRAQGAHQAVPLSPLTALSTGPYNPRQD